MHAHRVLSMSGDIVGNSVHASEFEVLEVERLRSRTSENVQEGSLAELRAAGDSADRLAMARRVYARPCVHLLSHRIRPRALSAAPRKSQTRVSMTLYQSWPREPLASNPLVRLREPPLLSPRHWHPERKAIPYLGRVRARDTTNRKRVSASAAT